MAAHPKKNKMTAPIICQMLQLQPLSKTYSTYVVNIAGKQRSLFENKSQYIYNELLCRVERRSTRSFMYYTSLVLKSVRVFRKDH